MSRREKIEPRRKRSQDDAITHGRGTIEEIRALCAVYDGGNFLASRTLATLIARLAQDELRLARMQGSTKLVSYARSISGENLMPQWRLIFVQIGGVKKSGATPITFLPNSSEPPSPLVKSQLLFRQWWNDPVYIESAGGSGCLIPVNDTPVIPFAKRKRLTRLSLINRLRNEVGAHFDGNESEDYAFTTTWNRCVSFGIVDDNGEEKNSDDHPEAFHFRNTFADAMVRCIAQEILESEIFSHRPDTGNEQQ